MELETKRQLIHASGVAFPFYVLYVGLGSSVATFLFLFVAGLIISKGYKRGIKFPVISGIVDSTEREEVIEDFPGRGALGFFLGSLLVLLFFGSDMNVACAAIIILALGDSFSTLVGRRYGAHKIFYSKEKSIEGTVGGLVPAFIGALVFVPAQVALAGAVAGMMVESLSIKIDDNVLIPLAAGFVMFLL